MHLDRLRMGRGAVRIRHRSQQFSDGHFQSIGPHVKIGRHIVPLTEGGGGVRPEVLPPTINEELRMRYACRFIGREQLGFECVRFAQCASQNGIHQSARSRRQRDRFIDRRVCRRPHAAVIGGDVDGNIAETAKLRLRHPGKKQQ